MHRLPDQHADAFIQRWKNSGASERANYQLFLSELCDLIGVPRPDPSQAENERNAYVFERPVTLAHSNGDTRPGFIDLYKGGCFVLEAKQGAEKANRSETPLSDSLRELQKVRKTGTAGTLAAFFLRTKPERVQPILDTLRVMGVV